MPLTVARQARVEHRRLLTHTGITVFARRVWRAFLFALVLAPVALCLWFVYRYGVDVPVFDKWVYVESLKSVLTGSMPWNELLFVQQNQHSMGFSCILLDPIVRLSHFDSRYEMYLSVAVMAGTVGVWALMLKDRLPAPWRLVALVPLAWITCTLRQHESLTGGLLDGFEIGLCSLLFVMTIFCLDRVRGFDLPFALAAFCTAGCIWTFGNGLLVLPFSTAFLCTSTLAFKGMPRKQAFKLNAAWIAFCVAVFAIFITHYKVKLEGSLVSFQQYAAANVLSVIKFFYAYLGAALTASPATDSAVQVGAVLLALLIVMLYLSISRKGAFQGEMLAPLFMALFVLASDCLTLYGRVRYGPAQATVSRYVCCSYLFTAGVFMFALSARKIRPLARGIILCALVAMTVIGTATTVPDGLVWGTVAYEYRTRLANLLRNYRWQDIPALTKLYPPPDTAAIINLASFLESNHLSVFRDEKPKALWAPAMAPVVQLQSICGYASQIADNLPVFVVDDSSTRYLEFSGWAADRQNRQAAGGLYICLDDKLEIPLAYGLERPDIAKALRRASYLRTGFTGSVLSSVIGPGVHSVSFKVLSPDRKRFYKTEQLAWLQIYDTVGHYFNKCLATGNSIRQNVESVPGSRIWRYPELIHAPVKSTRVTISCARSVLGAAQIMQIKLAAPETTDVRIYYQTRLQPEFSWKSSIARRVQGNGANVIDTILPASWNGKLAIEFDKPGDYRIDDLELRACLPPATLNR